MTDDEVRLYVYKTFVERGSPPTVAEVAQALGVGENDVADAYRRLEQGRVIVLAPGTLNIWMANPLCAYPSPFRVETPRGSYFGVCAWDALGVVAMLGGDGSVHTHCQDCAEPMTLRVGGGEYRGDDGVFHVAVPARRWWENIAFT